MTHDFIINANTINKVKTIYEATADSHQSENAAQKTKYKSFISHSTQEAQLGIVLQQYIESSFSNLSHCFLSRSNLLIGDNIAEQILDALAGTRLHIVLFSPESIGHHWLHLEAGAALFRRVPIVGLTHSGLVASELPDPYRSYLAADLDTVEGVARLCKTLAERAKVPPSPDRIIRRLYERLDKARQGCRE